MAIYQEKNKNKITKDGRSWYYKVYYTDIYGARKQKVSKMYKTKTESKNAEIEFLKITETKDKTNINISFEDVYNDWIGYKSKLLKSTTVYGIKKMLNKYILTFFKDFKLHYIKTNVINAWYDELEKSKTSLIYQNKIIGYLREIFIYARDNYDFDGRLISKVQKHRIETINRIKDSEWNYWTYEEFKKFISVVDDELFYSMFNFMYYTGLRLGETIALTWKEINLTRKTVNIYQNYTNKLGKKSHCIVDPKTKNSIRIVDLPDNIIDILKKHKEHDKKIDGFKETDIVFGNIRYTTPSTFERNLKKYIQLSNVKSITPHGFRHSHVSLLIHLGLDSRDVAERVGDTVQVIESTYYHMFPSKKKKTVEALNNLK